MRNSILLILLLHTVGLSAQQPSGLWILTHVKALQPVYTMVEIDGAFELTGDEPQDSSFLYNSGLMTIEFQKTNSAISHSWDGEEGWTVKLDKETLYLYGQRDTLFGDYNKDRLILRSTLDDRPTYYNFSPFEEKRFSTPALLEESWEIRSENSLLKDLTISFTTDSSYQVASGKSLNSQIYFTYSLGKLAAIEYDFPATSEMGEGQELGTIYFFKTRGGKVKGIFYPVTDGVTTPTKSELTLSKKVR